MTLLELSDRIREKYGKDSTVYVTRKIESGTDWIATVRFPFEDGVSATGKTFVLALWNLRKKLNP